MENKNISIVIVSALLVFGTSALAAPSCKQLFTEPVVGQYGRSIYSFAGVNASGQPIVRSRTLPTSEGSNLPEIQMQRSRTDCLPTVLSYAAQILKGYDYEEVYPTLRRELGTEEIMRAAQMSKFMASRNPFAMFDPYVALHAFTPPGVTQSMKLSMALTGLGIFTTPSNPSYETFESVRAKLNAGSFGLVGGPHVMKTAPVIFDNGEVTNLSFPHPLTSKDSTQHGAHTWLLTDTYKNPQTGATYVVLVEPHQGFPLLMSFEDFRRASGITFMWLR